MTDTSRRRIKILMVALAAAFPIAITIVTLTQHQSYAEFSPVFGSWSYFYFLFSLLPSLIVLPILFLAVIKPKYFAKLLVATLSLLVLFVPLEALTYADVIYDFSPRAIGYIPDACVRGLVADKMDFFRDSDILVYDGLPGSSVRPGVKYTLWATVDFDTTRTYPVSMDSNGFNNEQSIADLSKVDVAVIGDSHTHGSTRREANFISVASRLLGKFILNLGMGGNTTKQQRWIFENIGLDYEPDIVVWQFADDDVYQTIEIDQWLNEFPGLNYNEYQDRVRYENPPSREVECNGFRLNLPQIVLGLVRNLTATVRSFVPTQRVVVGQPSDGQPAVHITVPYPGSRLGSDALCGYPRSVADWQTSSRVTRKGTNIEFDVPVSQSLETIEGEIKAMAELGRARGFQIALMPVPSKYVVYEDQILDYLPTIGLGVECEDNSPPRLEINERYWHEWLEAAAAKYSLHYIDLPAHLQNSAAKQANDLLFYPLDGHMSESGNLTTGTFLNQELAKILDGG